MACARPCAVKRYGRFRQLERTQGHRHLQRCAPWRFASVVLGGSWKIPLSVAPCAHNREPPRPKRRSDCVLQIGVVSAPCWQQLCRRAPRNRAGCTLEGSPGLPKGIAMADSRVKLDVRVTLMECSGLRKVRPASARPRGAGEGSRQGRNFCSPAPDCCLPRQRRPAGVEGPRGVRLCATTWS